MNFLRFIYLIILSVSIISTAFSQQSKDSLITITSKEADFFIQWRLKAKSLIVDTTIFGQELRAIEGIVRLKNGQITNDSLMFIQKDKAFDTYKEHYNDLYKTYNKSEKWKKRYKNICGILLGVVAIETTLFIIVNK